MSERNRRGGRREQQGFRESRGFSERQYGRDEPWREERRIRYPDEPSGGAREGRQSFGGGARPYQDRGNFEGYREEGSREDDRNDDRWDRDRATGGFGSEYGAWRSGASFGFGREEDPRHETDWQGSPYGQGDMNTGRPFRGAFEDTDWIPNRPARGRGTWAGDWSMSPAGVGDYGSQPRSSYNWDRSGRPGAASSIQDDYTGRGPKDYRRSDERIREEICDRLTDDRVIDASDVTIKVEGGEVVLAGFVATREQKRRAEESAEGISGVRDVINQIRVSRSESGQPTSQPSQQSQQANRAQRSSSAGQQSGIAADRDR